MNTIMSDEEALFPPEVIELPEEEQKSDCETYVLLGNTYLDRADLATAATYFQAALESLTRTDTDVDRFFVADTMYGIGCVHEFQNEWQQAIAYFQKTLTIRETIYDRDHVLIANTLFHLGKAHTQLGDSDLGSACLEECLRIRVVAKGNEYDMISVADALFELAATLDENPKRDDNDDNTTDNKILDPTQCYVDAIRIYRKESTQSEKDYYIQIAKCLAHLAKIKNNNKDEEDIEKSKSCYKQALDIFESKLSLTPTEESLMDYRIVMDYEAYVQVLLDYTTFLSNHGSDDDNSSTEIHQRAEILIQRIPQRCEDDTDKSFLLSVASEDLEMVKKTNESTPFAFYVLRLCILYLVWFLFCAPNMNHIDVISSIFR
mmetsp:Transcript_15993/g.24209  ORF Transcript_15993/g.24209 Transcript_15993/m.24209 type:complete len:376 (+) Transcript_15993:126-1253(+)